ncbi:MAG: ARMT1-like domain-containing protein, partial [Phycisphaerales bacterium JB038]
MANFPLLADPDNYRACEWDLLTDPEGCSYWMRLFRQHFETFRRSALESGATEAQCGVLRQVLDDCLDELEARLRGDGAPLERLDILTLTGARDTALRAAGIPDAFKAIKVRETRAALALLPQRLRTLDEQPPAERPAELARGIFAGNIFDLGAVEVAQGYLDGASFGFEQAIEKVKPRPWLVDDADRLRFRGWKRAVVFVDNAGPDVVLGMLPLVRELLREGAQVLLAANTTPALNDITFPELTMLLAEVADLDQVLGEAFLGERLVPVATGTGDPLIDLTQVSDSFAQATAGADLVVLEGMGRALESNYTAAFTCATWHLGTIKDPFVARHFQGELYDC